MAAAATGGDADEGIHLRMRWRRWLVPVYRSLADEQDDAWVDIGRLADLTNNRIVVEVDGISVLIVRCGHSLAAVENECPHMTQPLSDGHITGRVIQCARHAYRWDLVSGAEVPCARGRVRRSLRHVPIRVFGDRLLIVPPTRRVGEA